MWIYLPCGFFSVVKPEPSNANEPDNRLMVRARVAEDLDNLRALFIPELSPTRKTPSRDYLFRAFCTSEEYARGMYMVAMSIDYTNFKDEVKKADPDRARLYMGVWSDMINVQEHYHPKESSYLTGSPTPSTKVSTKRQKQLNIHNYLEANFDIVPGQYGYNIVKRKVSPKKKK